MPRQLHMLRRKDINIIRLQLQQDRISTNCLKRHFRELFKFINKKEKQL